MTKDQLRQRLEFYQDLGIKTHLPPPSHDHRLRANPQPPTPNPSPVAYRPSNPRRIPCSRSSSDIGDCKRCRLHEARNKIVFGSGNEQARLVFVGEGPGADEDQQGLPFVGRAGSCSRR